MGCISTNAHVLMIVAQVQGSFEDVRAPPLTISTLQSLISLPLIRPELFRKGILKKNFIPGVLLFGPPGTGKVFYTCLFFVQLQICLSLSLFHNRPCWPRLWPKTVGVACWTFKPVMCKLQSSPNYNAAGVLLLTHVHFVVYLAMKCMLGKARKMSRYTNRH